MDITPVSRPVLADEFSASKTEALPISVMTTNQFLLNLHMLSLNVTLEVPGAHRLQVRVLITRIVSHSFHSNLISGFINYSIIEDFAHFFKSHLNSDVKCFINHQLWYTSGS